MEQPVLFDLSRRFVALEDHAAELLEPGPDFWRRLAAGDYGRPQRLLSAFRIERDWRHWERCVAGPDIACLLDGAAEFIVRTAAGRDYRRRLSRPGLSLLLPQGSRYRVTVAAPALILFLSAGQGQPAEALAR